MEKEVNTLLKNNNGNGKTHPQTTDEKLKEFFKKISPYIKRAWENKKRILTFNSIVALIAIAALIFFVKPYFESSISILPEYGSKTSMLGQLSNLAAMAGVNMGDAEPTEIYQNILMSESVIKPVVYSKYKTEEYADSVNLIQYFEVEPDDNLSPELQKRKMFLKIYSLLTKKKINTTIDRVTKILTVSVEMPESKLSADVVNNLANSLDEYVRTQRKSYSSEQRFYIEKRLSQVSDSLKFSEEKLKRFREKNRVTGQSPELTLEQARLVRSVDILETVFTELTKQLEIAKIDEIKDAPVINIKEAALDPIEKKGPSKMILLIIILFFSFVGSLAYSVFKPEFIKYKSLLKL